MLTAGERGLRGTSTSMSLLAVKYRAGSGERYLTLAEKHHLRRLIAGEKAAAP